MVDEIIVNKNLTNNTFEVSYKGNVYRTVYVDLHARSLAVYITGYTNEFSNVEEAIDKAVELTRAEILQRNKQNAKCSRFK